MSNKTHEPELIDDEMREEYDFSGRTSVRGKYYQKLRQGYTIKVQREDGTILVQHITRPEGTVMLDADVREYFPDTPRAQPNMSVLVGWQPRTQGGTHEGYHVLCNERQPLIGNQR